MDWSLFHIFAGIYLSDVMFINSAYPPTSGIESHERSDKINNILRVVAEFQKSEYGELHHYYHPVSILIIKNVMFIFLAMPCYHTTLQFTININIEDDCSLGVAQTIVNHRFLVSMSFHVTKLMLIIYNFNFLLFRFKISSGKFIYFVNKKKTSAPLSSIGFDKFFNYRRDFKLIHFRNILS